VTYVEGELVAVDVARLAKITIMLGTGSFRISCLLIYAETSLLIT
jgi:hypothetical protein